MPTNAISFLEFHASKIYYKIINEESIEILSDKERTIFSHFIFIQYTRTKAARELFKQIYDLAYEDLVQTKNYPTKANFDEELFNSFLKDQAFLAQLRIIFDPSEDNDKLMKIPLESSKLIFNLRMETSQKYYKIEFYSSDHPILLFRN